MKFEKNEFSRLLVLRNQLHETHKWALAFYCTAILVFIVLACLNVLDLLRFVQLAFLAALATGVFLFIRCQQAEAATRTLLWHITGFEKFNVVRIVKSSDFHPVLLNLFTETAIVNSWHELRPTDWVCYSILLGEMRHSFCITNDEHEVVRVSFELAEPGMDNVLRFLLAQPTDIKMRALGYDERTSQWEKPRAYIGGGLYLGALFEEALRCELSAYRTSGVNSHKVASFADKVRVTMIEEISDKYFGGSAFVSLEVEQLTVAVA